MFPGAINAITFPFPLLRVRSCLPCLQDGFPSQEVGLSSQPPPPPPPPPRVSEDNRNSYEYSPSCAVPAAVPAGVPARSSLGPSTTVSSVKPSQLFERRGFANPAGAGGIGGGAGRSTGVGRLSGGGVGVGQDKVAGSVAGLVGRFERLSPTPVRMRYIYRHFCCCFSCFWTFPAKQALLFVSLGLIFFFFFCFFFFD